MRIDLCFLSAVCTAGRAAESDRRGTRALDLHKPEKRAKAKSSTSSHRSSRRATKRAQKFGGANSKDVDTGVDSRGGEKVPSTKRGSFPVLVLNADYQPLSYLPLSVWPWQEAVKAFYLDRVSIVATYNSEVRSPSVTMEIPSVVCLRSYHKHSLKSIPAFTRFNVFLRDNFRCQYCGKRQKATDLTFDHVLPKKYGGKCNWSNIVSACIKCNGRKGSRMIKNIPDMALLKTPTVPTMHELQFESRKFPPKYLHESWRDYLYWDTPMEQE
mmetsp:Transcript_28185/g.110739  ORF Transcript_28185/g.110739 Transcript_28185/m.110739 type:complete len:270 (-) Transcript_28185:951-1760(-)